MTNVTESGSEATGGGFASLGLDERLVRALSELGYEEPTPIQREAIPPLLERHDLLGQAATGTGKTAAFALPILQRLANRDGNRPSQPFALTLVPTRELAIQVAEAMHRYGRPFGATVLPIYGGQSFGQQIRGIQRGVDVIVATPGRILDHLRRETLSLDTVETVVLDEADEMLDMGFIEDIEAILSSTPETRQTVLFSATLPPRIHSIVKRHLKDPRHIQLAAPVAPKGEAPRVRQTAYVVQRAFKMAALDRVLDLESPGATLVFCRTRNEVDELTEALSSRGYRTEALHGGMSQEQRERVLKKLQSGASDLVVATDVAARGLDIERLTHVVNYDLPSAPDSYVHRIGRVGRAGREGVAITLLQPREHRLLRIFEQATKQKIEIGKVPTLADLRAQRLEITRAALRETLLAGDLESVRVAVESLAEEFDLSDIAAAAVKLAFEATERAVENDEPHELPGFEPRERQAFRPRPEFAGDGPREQNGPRRGGRGGDRSPGQGMVRLYVNAGREAGVRPQDLVGAITGEAGIAGNQIGAIQLADRFSLVDVSEDLAERVISALNGRKIRGKIIRLRRDREA
ncbi:MAG TPA: DEAD/DEAH box helicase [Pirellulaceae bacterium]|jgi:ATP-dependent RNA helicase DeaD|nr:DEAD/DEAH box helicase [Pirellulaceae bacterium]